jgi:hypothetical protein
MSDTILVVAVLAIYPGETAKVLFADWILNQALKRAQAQVGRVIAQPVQASSSPAHCGELGGETETVEAGRHERSDMRDRTVMYCTGPGCRCAHPGYACYSQSVSVGRGGRADDRLAPTTARCNAPSVTLAGSFQRLGHPAG